MIGGLNTGMGGEGTDTLSGGDNGFFSFLNPVFDAVQQGLVFSGQQILPRYLAQQSLGQAFDQTYNPTFYAPAALPRQQNEGLNATGVKKTGLLFDNVNMTGGSMLLAAVAVLGLVLIIKG